MDHHPQHQDYQQNSGNDNFFLNFPNEQSGSFPPPPPPQTLKSIPLGNTDSEEEDNVDDDISEMHFQLFTSSQLSQMTNKVNYGLSNLDTVGNEDVDMKAEQFVESVDSESEGDEESEIEDYSVFNFGSSTSTSNAQQLMTTAPTTTTTVQPESNKEYQSHSTESYRCSAIGCGSVYSSFKQLQSHQRAHKIGKTYQCPKCSKVYIYDAYLQKHLRNHSVNYPCTSCFKTFNLPYQLKKHERIHHNRKKSANVPKLYQCQHCTASFTKSYNLKSHQIIHNGSKNFACSKCSEKFRKLNDLKAHYRIHTGGTKHICEYCGRMLLSASSLKAHIRVHTGEKPFKCTTCLRGFGTFSQLKGHQMTHLKKEYISRLREQTLGIASSSASFSATSSIAATAESTCSESTVQCATVSVASSRVKPKPANATAMPTVLQQKRFTNERTIPNETNYSFVSHPQSLLTTEITEAIGDSSDDEESGNQSNANVETFEKSYLDGQSLKPSSHYHVTSRALNTANATATVSQPSFTNKVNEQSIQNETEYSILRRQLTQSSSEMIDVIEELDDEEDSDASQSISSEKRLWIDKGPPPEQSSQHFDEKENEVENAVESLREFGANEVRISNLEDMLFSWSLIGTNLAKLAANARNQETTRRSLLMANKVTNCQPKLNTEFSEDQKEADTANDTDVSQLNSTNAVNIQSESEKDSFVSMQRTQPITTEMTENTSDDEDNEAEHSQLHVTSRHFNLNIEVDHKETNQLDRLKGGNKVNHQQQHQDYNVNFGLSMSTNAQQKIDVQSESESQTQSVKCYRCPVEGCSHVSKCFLQFEEHQRVHTRDKLLKCPECSNCFRHLSALQAHQRIHDDINKFKCLVCLQSFTEVAALQQHQLCHRHEKPYECPYCPESFHQLSDLNAHLSTHLYRRSSYQCSVCYRSFTRADVLSKHQLTCQNYDCPHCSLTFRKPTHLKTHLKFHNGAKAYPCLYCGRKFIYNSNLKAHLSMHTGEKPFKCTECTASFRLKYQLLKHKCTNNRTDYIQCSNAVNTATLSTVNTTSAVFPFVPNERAISVVPSRAQYTANATATFSQLSSTYNQVIANEPEYSVVSMQHRQPATEIVAVIENSSDNEENVVNTVEESDDSQSDESEKRLWIDERTSTHLSQHSNEEEKKVESQHENRFSELRKLLTSSVVVTNQPDQRSHQIDHSSNAPNYTCSQCFVTFSKMKDFKTHKLTHNDGKQFTCPECNKRLCNATALKAHLLVHTGEKPFKCPECSKPFRQLVHLKTHQRIHRKRDIWKPFTDAANKCVIQNEAEERRDDLQHDSFQQVVTAEESDNQSDESEGRLWIDEGTPEQSPQHFDEVEYAVKSTQKLGGLEFGIAETVELLTSESATGTNLPEPRENLSAREKAVCQSSQMICNVINAHPELGTGQASNVQSASGNESQLKPIELQCKVPGCNLVFDSGNNLKRHQQLHGVSNQYKCPTCSKTFIFSKYLQKHKLTHHAPKDYICQQCSKGFFNSSNLNRHIQRIHIEKPHKCSYCSATFRQVSDLTRHKITRHGIDEVSCPQCSEIFENETDLEVHQRTRHPKCPQCLAELSSEADLIVHQCTHSEERPINTSTVNSNVLPSASSSAVSLPPTHASGAPLAIEPIIYIPVVFTLLNCSVSSLRPS